MIMPTIYKTMATLTKKTRQEIPRTDFALSGRRYPIEDKVHARDALSRVSANGNTEEKVMVRREVARRFPSVKQSKGKESMKIRN